MLIKHKNFLPILLAISIFFFRIPPFYIVNTSLFLTYNVGRILILLVFCVIIITKYVFFVKNIKRWFFVILILFFASQSICIINAINILEYIKAYKEYVIFVVIYVSTYLIIDKYNYKTSLALLLIGNFINIIIQILLYHDLYILNFFKLNLEHTYTLFYNYQQSRGRYFGESFDEVSIPLIFIFLNKKKNFYSFCLILLMSAICYIVIISNWRTKTVICIFSTLLTFCFLFIKKRKDLLLKLIPIMCIVIGVGSVISIHKTGNYVGNRLIMGDLIDVKTIEVRLKYWIKAIEIGSSHKLIGVGLKNYYDFLSNGEKAKVSVNSNLNSKFIIIDDPHNIFLSTYVSSGFIGLFALILFIFYSLFSDLSFIVNKYGYDTNIILIMISSWSLFLFSLFNPFLYWQFLYLFAFLRGCIAKLTND